MFLGTYSPRMDAKGRIILPAKFCEGSSAGLAPDPRSRTMPVCFPAAEFERIHERMRTAPLPGRAARDFLRVFPLRSLRRTARQAGTHHHPSDTAPVRRTDRQPVVIGSGTRAEIWDAAVGEEYLACTEAEFASPDEDPFSLLL